MNEYIKYINSKQWHDKSKWFRNVMLNRCALLPFLKSNDVHHMTYKNLKHEILLRDVVPLSRFAHNFVHCVARLGYRRHDIQWIRFIFNWVLLRPFCLFWLLTLTLWNVLSQLLRLFK